MLKFSKKYRVIPSETKTKRHILFILIFSVFLFMAMLVFMSGDASAEFKGENDWNNSDRTLCYTIDDSVTDQWKGWIEEAIQNWNNVSEQTGWSFHECQQGEKTQVEFELSDDNRANGGAEVQPVPFPDPIEKLTIHIDKNLSDETWPGGTKASGWSKTGNDTLDPVLVLKHELSHVIRLDHSGGTDTGNLEDPITPGNHNNPPNREPSNDDIKEAKNASDDKKGWGKKKNIGQNGGEIIHMNMSVFFPQNTLAENISIEISPVTKTHTPDPTKLDTMISTNGQGIVSAVQIYNKTRDIELSQPATVSISYTEEDISGGYILGMRHSKIFPAINETTIQAYKYNKTTKTWNSIVSEINRNTNTIHFQTTKLGIFGAGGKTDSSTLLYDTDENGQINGEEVRRAIRCFLFNGQSCIGEKLTGQETRDIIRSFLF